MRLRCRLNDQRGSLSRVVKESVAKGKGTVESLRGVFEMSRVLASSVC